MGRVGLLLVLVVLGAGCGGSASTSSERPCVVAEEEMASIWNVPEMRAFPQGNGYQCIYAADGQPVISLAVRSPEQFEAERAKFEDHGVLLPPLEPVSGFDGEANVEPALQQPQRFDRGTKWSASRSFRSSPPIQPNNLRSRSESPARRSASSTQLRPGIPTCPRR
jgi:hypothetical protein